MKEEADVLGSTSLIDCMVPVDVKQHLKKRPKKMKKARPRACP